MERDSDVIVGRLRLEPSDIQKAAQQTPEGRRLRLIALGLSVGLPLMIVIGATTQADFRWQNAIPSTVAVLFIVGVTLRVFRSAGRKALEWRDERQLDMTYRFESSGYDISNQASASRGEWSTLHHWVETPSAFLLYVAPSLPIAVPKRAFPEADLSRLRALLEARVGTAGTRAGVEVRRRWLGWTVVAWLALIAAFFLIHAYLGPS